MISKNILKEGEKEGYCECEVYEAYKTFFGTLVSEPRLKIINLLRAGKKNVSEIIEELKMDQAALSHNLSKLRACGFVKSERDGKFVNYKLDNKTIKPLMDLIDKHMSENCIKILRKMKEVSKK